MSMACSAKHPRAKVLGRHGQCLPFSELGSALRRARTARLQARLKVRVTDTQLQVALSLHKKLALQVSDEVKPLKLVYAIKNIMFDESTFDLSFADGIRASYSVLCSHAQLTYRVEGRDVVHDEHIDGSPSVHSPVMNSATMHAALSAGPGGFAQTLHGNVKFLGTLTTSDAHAANVRLLKFVDQELGQNHFFIPSLCLQHRVGNIVEQ